MSPLIVFILLINKMITYDPSMIYEIHALTGQPNI